MTLIPSLLLIIRLLLLQQDNKHNHANVTSCLNDFTPTTEKEICEITT